MFLQKKLELQTQLPPSEKKGEDKSDNAELEELDLGKVITPGSLFQLSFTRKWSY